MRELLERLCALNAVSSWEDEVRALLLAEVEPHADRLRVDALGNLIAWKKGAGNIPAASFSSPPTWTRLGSMDPPDHRRRLSEIRHCGRHRPPGAPGQAGAGRAQAGAGGGGTQGLPSGQPGGGEVRPQAGRVLYRHRSQGPGRGEAQVALGDTAAFDSDAGDFGAGLFHGKALGSRLGCAVLLTLLRDELPMDCTFVFTAQKEVGARGAFGAAFSVTPEVALVVDGADAADLAGVPAHKQGCSLGGGVVLPYMDQGAIADRGLFEALRSLAESGGIPWQTMRSVDGRTDAAAIQRTKEGVRTAAVSIPVRYPRTPSGVTCLRDAEAALALIRAFVGHLAEKE